MKPYVSKFSGLNKDAKEVERLQTKLDTFIRKIEDAKREVATGRSPFAVMDILRAAINEAKS